MIKNEKIDLTILVLFSLLLSTYLFLQTYVISLDGAFQYIPMAKDFASGFFKKGIQEWGPQLYGLLGEPSRKIKYTLIFLFPSFQPWLTLSDLTALKFFWSSSFTPFLSRNLMFRRRKSVAIFLIILSSIILFLPYLLHLREITGGWTLNKAKSVEGILGWAAAGSQVSLLNKVLYSLKKLNLEIIAIYHPLYIFLLVLGLWKRISSHFRAGEGLLVSFCLLHYAVLFLMILNLTNWSEGEKTQSFVVSGRHVLPLLLTSIYWVGEGFLTIYHWIYKKIESQRLFLRLESRRRSNLVFVTLLILILAIVLPKTLKPQRYERLSEKWAGIWIKNQSGKGMTIFTTVPRVAYYADGNYEYIDLKQNKWDKLEASIVEKGGSYLVIRQRDIIDFPNETGSIKNNFIEVIRYEKKGMEKIIVYKRVE